MSPPSRKQLKRGAAGFGDYPENYDFLQADNERGNWVAGASGVGYQGERFDDDYGYRRGQGAYTDENEDGLKLRNVLPSERQNGVSDRLADLPWDDEFYGSGSAITGGGGPMGHKYPPITIFAVSSLR